MQIDKIQQIKNHFSIVELAQRFGCRPNSRGNCKYNALRVEKTSSLTVYPETNTYCDFGSSNTGDIIEFYSLATGKSKAEAVNMAAMSVKGRVQVQATLVAVKEMAGWTLYACLACAIFVLVVPYSKRKLVS